MNHPNDTIPTGELLRMKTELENTRPYTPEVDKKVKALQVQLKRRETAQ
jgi:hypothetical protein